MLKNGKLFGKINIIDFLAVLALIVVVAAAAVFVLRPKDGGDTLVMKFRIEEVDGFVAEKVHVGDELYDDTNLQDIGVVTDVELSDSISYGQVNDSVYTLTSKEGYYSMIITGEVKGRKTKLGAEIGGKKYGVGHSMVLRAGDAKMYLRVYDIALKDENGEIKTDDSTDNLVPVNLTFYAEETPEYVANNIKAGDKAVDAARRSTELGVIDTIETGDAVVFVETETGLLESSKPGYASVTFTTTVDAEKADGGVKIGERVYSVGDEIDMRAGSSRLTVFVRSIDVQ